MNDRPLAGRTALVTGGAKGIGRACCLKLAQAGADVAINYLTSEGPARETAEEVRRAGVRAHLVRADVSSPEQVAAMVQDVTDALGPVDLLVNNAGVFHFLPHEETTLEVWRQTMEVNLTGSYLVTWAVKQSMIERGFGRIVNIASIAGLRPRPMSIAYAASKAGLIGLTKSLAEALAPHNIRINAVAPGLIDTEILSGVSQNQIDSIVQSTPLGRIGHGDDVADAALFLLSEQSSFMTGQTLVVCGGRVMLP
ncbi:MAG: SDR family oxidoreductase [Planctomycetaceae bacterium]|nr:SDR family oxidoreductase [Planctomycetaceae bacterium]